MSENEDKLEYMDFRLNLISEKKNMILDLYFPPNGFISFLKIFDPNAIQVGNEIKWNAIQQKEPNLIERINRYTEDTKKDMPHLKKLFHDFLNPLQEREYFYLINHTERTTKDLNALWRNLGRQNERALNIAFDERVYDLGSTVLNYNIGFIGTERKSFGRFEKNDDKICRFCKGVEGNENFANHIVTFKRRAHLIAEALGNKRIMSLDECDYCNDYFSKTIEPSIVNFLSPFRSLYGISGKGGKKKLIGESFELDPVEGFNIRLPGDIDDYLGETFSLLLKLQEKYIPANVYRCLVKFILAVLPKDELPNYCDTLLWILNTDKVALPKVAIVQNANFFTDHPYLVKYKRNNTDFSFPDLIGEFRYGDIMMIFIVPFSKLDKYSFVSENEVNKFWNSFIGFRNKLPWKFVDFSSRNEIKTIIDFTVKNVKIGGNAFLSRKEV